MAENTRYFTLEKVAERFNVNPRTLRRWWLSNKTCLKVWVPSHLIGVGHLRFLASSVEEFEKTGRVHPEDYEGEVEINHTSRNKNTAGGAKLKRLERKGERL